MQSFVALFVNRPLSSAIVAVALLAIRLVVVRAGRPPIAARWWLIAGVCWLAYAGWEYLVTARTPDANIRVDLLLIFPILLAVTLWAVFRTVRA